MRSFAPLLLSLLLAACSASGGSEPAAEPAGDDKSAATASEGDAAREGAPEDVLSVSSAGWSTDFSKHTVPLSSFLGGGPPKDGIPAVDAPRFVTVEEAGTWIAAREPVVELELAGEAKAYPLQILVWHEIVNDEVAGTPVTVTFCPLCNTALAFDRRLDGRVLDFGTTGNLRNADLVMYDRQTESWWQQFGGEAVVGELAGAKLTPLPARIVAFEDFAARHPDGEVLGRDTGYSRSYGENPYAGYDDVDSPPFFPAAGADDDRLPPKERVVFVERSGDALVVPFADLAREGRIEVEAGGELLEVIWVPGVSSALDSAAIADGREVGSADARVIATGERIPFDTPFWFAVASFRPDARIVSGSR